jgi:hypothetical protein
MDALTLINTSLETCQFESVWGVRVELATRDDARVREAVKAAVGLRYGDYEGVAFESATGMQFFRPLAGSAAGNIERSIEMPARILSFNVPRDPAILAAAVEAVRHSHSYEEPVITVQEVLACRTDASDQRDNPNRWWNRGFTE